MRTWTPLALALLGCTDDPGQLPPPPNVTVELIGPTEIEPGTTATFEVILPAGAPDNLLTFFPVTTQGLGNGICPPDLDGQCLGIVGPLVYVGSARSSGTSATWSIDIPAQVGVSEVAIQAVVDTWEGPVLSNPLVLPVAGGGNGGTGGTPPGGTPPAGNQGRCNPGYVEITGTTLPSLHMQAMALVDMNQATHMAMGSGDWSDPSIWDNGVPGPGARVFIPMGAAVRMDTVTDDLESLGIAGTLSFANDMDTELRVDTMVSMATGVLEIGTAAAPIQPDVTARVVFIDDGPIDPVADPGQIGRGATLMGRTTIVGADKLDWTALDLHPIAGASTLELAAAPSGWRVGDQIVIAATDTSDPTSDETRVITAISGTTITLDAPLARDHVAPASDLDVHVANLTRNVQLTSESTQIAHRGHVMFMHTLYVDVRNAAFTHLGRTDKTRKVDDLNFPELDDGILCMGARNNIRGRYSVHFHRGGTDPNRTPARVEGSVVVDDPGWAYVNHSASVDFVSNVSYRVVGGAYQTEAGDEVGSFVDNIALHTVNPEMPLRGGRELLVDIREDAQDFAFQGDAFWLHSGGVRVEGNVASGTSGHAFIYWTEGLIEEGGVMRRVSPSTVPDGALWGNTPAIDVWWVPVESFRGNQAYSATKGMEIYYLHATFLNRQPVAPQPYLQVLHSTFEDFTLWGMHDTAISFNYSENITLRNVRIVGDGQPGKIAIDANHFHLLSDYTFEDLDISDYDVGMDVPTQGRITIRNGTFANKTDFRVLNPQFGPRLLEFDGVQFADSPLFSPSERTKILMAPDFTLVGQTQTGLDDDGANKIPLFFLQPDRITLNFGPYTNEGLYYDQQRADFIPMLPANATLEDVTVRNRFVNKTNQQLNNQYGWSFGGAILPAGATTIPEVVGGKIGTPAPLPTFLPPEE